MKALKRSWLVTLAWVWCGGASAATLIVNCSTASGPTELSSNIVCGQFNIPGQTVTAISIAITGGINGSVTLTNGGSTTTTMAGTTTSQLNVAPMPGFPIVNPVYTASFTTGNQSVNVGTTITFSGLSGSGNGSIGSNTTIFAPYVGAGFFNIPVSTATGFTVVGGGGFAMAAAATSANGTAVVTYTYFPTVPDLTITKSHSGSFAQGQVGAQYTITVSNSGFAPTSGTATVTDTLPAGLTPTGATGTGWICGISLQVVTCTSSAVIGAPGSYPPITLTVDVAPNAPLSLINTASVSGGGETDATNDTAPDPTTVAVAALVPMLDGSLLALLGVLLAAAGLLILRRS